MLLPLYASSAYKEELKESPYIYFKNMLEQACKENYKDLSHIIVELRPLFDDIKTHFNVDLEEEANTVLKEGNKDDVIKNVFKVVYYDIKNIFLMINVKEIPEEEFKLHFKMAVMDYKILAILINNQDQAVEEKIMGLMKQAFQIINRENWTDDDYLEFKTISGDIDTKLQKYFPTELPE